MSSLRLVALGLCLVNSVLQAQEEEFSTEIGPAVDESDAGIVPRALVETDFAPLTESSPFIRTIAPANSLVLTGVAHIDGKVIATVVDSQTRESHFLSEAANDKGWRLLEVDGAASIPDSLRATIQLGVGEKVTIRYAMLPPPGRGRDGRSSSGGSSGKRAPAPLSRANLSEAQSAARNYKVGFSSDGYPAEPPPATMKKLSQLSVQQRETINREMIQLNNQGFSSKERIPIYEKKIDQALQSRR